MIKPTKRQQKFWDEDSKLINLLRTYWACIKYEVIPKTKAISKNLDRLEVDIRNRKEELIIKKKEKNE